MTEMKYNVERAQHWRYYFDMYGIVSHQEWYIHVGLWETLDWLNPNNVHPKFKWLRH